MDIRPGTTIEGPDGSVLTIESLLGSGGFGQVFLARSQDGIRVAVKTVQTAALDANSLRTLQNEAKHAVEVNHPNVVRVLYVNDGEEASGRPPYLVMEYVDGGTLADAIQRRKGARSNFAIDELRVMYLNVAEGMVAVSARLVHRDLKPANVLIDGAGRLKIADFGLAKLVDAATRSETFKGWGTRPYQAPEAFDGGPNTPAMDIYAGGVLFFELAALVWPIEPKVGDISPIAWRNAHLLTPPKDLHTIRGDLPQDIVQLILLMLQKNPAKRPQSWSAVAERLRKTSPPPGRPDVSALVSKATATLVRVSAEEVRTRAEQERLRERTALLEQAFAEPVAVLASLVDAFNDDSVVGKLVLRTTGPLDAEVRSQVGHQRLMLKGQIVDDLDIHQDGVVRTTAIAQLSPGPTPRNPNDVYRDRESMGSFNLVYRVARADERFGHWTQFRFEVNPIVPQMTYPRWFGMELRELPHELQILHVTSQHQHEHRQLDDEWFKMLLAQML